MPNDISQLLAALSDRDLHRRMQAVEQLARLGADARPAAVPLVRLCGDDDEQIREWATAALEELGPPAPADAAALVELLKDHSSDVATWSATLLGRLGPQGAVAVKPLADIVASSRPGVVRQRAAWALGQIGPAAADSLAVLQKAAASDDARLARLAQRAIEQVQR
jgi:HEAT repeat protein